jgi:hypothetical protein
LPNKKLVLWKIDAVERRKEKMLGYDDSVGFGDVRDGVFGEVSEPFVLGQWIEQDAFLDFAQKVDAVKDVAQEIVDLNAHGRVEIVQVGRSQHLLRISDLNAQRRQLLVREMAGRCRGAPDNDEKMIIRKTRRAAATIWNRK